MVETKAQSVIYLKIPFNMATPLKKIQATFLWPGGGLINDGGGEVSAVFGYYPHLNFNKV